MKIFNYNDVSKGGKNYRDRAIDIFSPRLLNSMIRGQNGMSSIILRCFSNEATLYIKHLP